MKIPEKSFQGEVQDLLKKTVTEETVEKVFIHFERALLDLEPESLSILRKHFDGKTIPELSKLHSIEEAHLSCWIRSIKRDLIESLRRDLKVRQ